MDWVEAAVLGGYFVFVLVAMWMALREWGPK